MNIHGKSIATTFILGAGGSRGAIRHVLVNRKRIKAPLNFDFFDVAATYARARGAESADTKRLERLRTLFKNDLPIKWPPPMETAFSLLHTAKDFPEIYSSGPGRRPYPGERRELEDFLALLSDILNTLDLRAGGQTGYDRLASVLEPGDTLITLNYDTMLDSALVRRGWEPNRGYGLRGNAKKFKWKAARATGATNARGVKLLKLHGSLNWWVRGSHATLANVFSNKPTVITRPRMNGMARKIRQIIPPIYGKVFGHAHWRNLWGESFRALCSTEFVVVVGCSIVDTDYHLQALLRRVVKERKKRGDRFDSVVLVDRVRIRRRWKKVLMGAVTRYREFRSFEEFLNRGAHV